MIDDPRARGARGDPEDPLARVPREAAAARLRLTAAAAAARGFLVQEREVFFVHRARRRRSRGARGRARVDF
eukprot:12012-Pelagococcus_subviridis.AAC.2